MPKTNQETTTKSTGKWPWILLVVALLFTAFVRIRLLSIPFERDEGEFAYMGQLMLQGIPPYKIAFNMKMPGIYAFYALIMAVFGQTIAGVHFGFLLVSLGTIILLFLLVKRVFGIVAAAGAALTYSILSVHPSVLGTSAHASHFVVLFALWGMLAALKAVDSKRSSLFFLSGMLFGLSFLMKQPGGIIGLMAFGYALWHEWKQRSPLVQAARRLGFFVLGGMAPLICTVLLLWQAGVLTDFFFWTYTYLKTYAAQVPASMAPGMLVANCRIAVMDGTWPLYLVALLGLALTFADRGLRPRAGFAVAFTLMCFLAVCPGFYFRPHYFVLLLPAVAMLVGVVLHWIGNNIRSEGWRVPAALACLLLFALGLGYAIADDAGFFFTLTPKKACAYLYSGNAFEASEEIADYIREHTTEKDRVAVVGSEPQIYFYSGRKAAVTYIYMYPLMEANPFAHKMQQDFIRQIEKTRPKYLVFAGTPTSWCKTEDSDKLIYNWLPQYGNKHYRIVGLIETLDQFWIQSYWDENAVDRMPRTEQYVSVFVRKEP